jgi:hypothetical protein
MDYKKSKSIILSLSILIPFLLALATPIFMYDDGTVEKGWLFFVFGWLSIFDGNLAWFANIPLLIAVLTLNQKSNYSILSATISLFLSLTIFDYDAMGAVDSAKSVNINIGMAAYFWFTTISMVFIISLIKFLNFSKNQ